MQVPGTPAREPERLAALRCLGILDTPPSEAFDRITQLASRLLDVPIVLVSLVDGTRQWFKSRVGLEASETPREISFCAHAVYEQQILNIPDATLDARFAGNPLVTQAPYIRAYLGVPIYSREGHAIGTLCAIDIHARDFDQEDVSTLSQLAKILEDSIHAQQLATSTESVLHLANERAKLFRDTFEQAAVGMVHTSLAGKMLRVNQRTCAMLGYTEHELHETSFLSITHPDDVARNVELFRAMTAGRLDSYEMEKRFVCKGGALSWAHLSVALKRSASGQPDYVITVIEDINARKQAEAELLATKISLQTEVALQTQQLLEQTRELQKSNVELRSQFQKTLDSERAMREVEHRLRAIANSVPAIIGYWNRELRCEFANEGYRELFGIDPQLIVGMSMPKLLGDDRFQLLEPHVRLALVGEAQRFEDEFIKANGTRSYVEVRYIPDFNESVIVRGFFVLVTDITEARRTRMALETANAKLTNDSATDFLTGLSNRRVFSERSEEACRRYKKNGEVYGLILLDLDDFKQINDSYGHDVGDEVLRLTGRVLHGQLRSHRDVAARLGGEEFAILVFGDFDEELLGLIAERIREQINKESLVSEKGALHFTGSFGFAISDGGDQGWKSIFARADAALYEAKLTGKDRVVFGAATSAAEAAGRLKALRLVPSK